MGIPRPEPLGERGPDLHYFVLGDDTWALMPWMLKSYSRRQLTREERIANYRMQEGCGESIWNPGKQIQDLNGHNLAKAIFC